MKSINIMDLKKKAEILRDGIINGGAGIPTRQNCLDIIANINGFNNWEDLLDSLSYEDLLNHV